MYRRNVARASTFNDIGVVGVGFWLLRDDFCRRSYMQFSCLVTLPGSSIVVRASRMLDVSASTTSDNVDSECWSLPAAATWP